MRKLLSAAAFVAAGLAVVAFSTTARRAEARSTAVVEKGAFSVSAHSGYPKNVQGKDEESRITAKFTVTSPYLYDEGTQQSEALYQPRRACMVAAPGDHYATAGYFSLESYTAGSTCGEYHVEADFYRLKSGQTYTIGFFVEMEVTLLGWLEGYDDRVWLAATPPTVTTDGTDRAGMQYFRFYNGGVTVGQSPSFLGGGLTRIAGGWQLLQPDNYCLYFSIGTPMGFVVVHTPAGSSGRVEWTDWEDETPDTERTTGTPPAWSKLVTVKNTAGVSTATSQVHRVYEMYLTAEPDAGEYVMPGPMLALKSVADPLLVEVPVNQR